MPCTVSCVCVWAKKTVFVSRPERTLPEWQHIGIVEYATMNSGRSQSIAEMFKMIFDKIKTLFETAQCIVNIVSAAACEFRAGRLSSIRYKLRVECLRCIIWSMMDKKTSPLVSVSCESCPNGVNRKFVRATGVSVEVEASTVEAVASTTTTVCLLPLYPFSLTRLCDLISENRHQGNNAIYRRKNKNKSGA